MSEDQSNIPQDDQDGNKNNINPDLDWFKIHRSVYKGQLHGRHDLQSLWFLLISEATWKTHKRGVKQYKRGVYYFGIEKLTGILGYASSKPVKNKLLELEEFGYIKLEKIKFKCKWVFEITICNYSRYQWGTQSENNLKLISNKSEINLNVSSKYYSKELKKEEPKKEELKKEEKSNSSISPKPSVSGSRVPKKTLPISEKDKQLGCDWLSFAKEKLPFLKQTEESFAQEIYKARKAVGLDDEQMRAMFSFISEDEFWKTNCYSPAGLLRKSKNGLRKIDNILAKLRKDKYSHADVLKWARESDEAEARGEKIKNWWEV